MARPYGISGTPWHVERIHNDDPGDSRRHRSRCAYYDKESKHCAKAYGVCVGASHCKLYREKRADLVEYKAPEKLAVSNISSSKYDSSSQLSTEKQSDIAEGSFVVSNNMRYIVLKRNPGQNRTTSYLCHRVIMIPGIGNAKSNRRWIYKNYFLANYEKYTISGSEIQKVESIPSQYYESFAKRNRLPVKSNQDAKVPSVATKTGTTKINVQIESVAVVMSSNRKYKVIAFEGKLRAHTDRRALSQMVYRTPNGKQLPVSVDHEKGIIYVTKTLFQNHEDEFRTTDDFRLFPA